MDEALFHQGWTYFEQRPDKQYSLTDCLSFVLMHRLNLTHVALPRSFS